MRSKNMRLSQICWSMGKEMGKVKNKPPTRLGVSYRKDLVGPPGFEPGTNGL